ncbi:MAG: protein phosphatase 2C domain-containing protein [Myxococcota bacterium]
MDVQFWAATDPGQIRDHNEDNYLVDKRLKLFVVCDGMGGHAAGEVASALTVKTTREVVASSPGIIEDLEHDPDNPHHRQAVLSLLEHAVEQACALVFSAAEGDSERGGMGTTCSMMLVSAGYGFIAHVGDSRIYRLREGEPQQLTEDHSLLNEMIRQGRAQQGDSIPNQHAVTRAVGVRATVEVDTMDFEVRPEDRFIMCSDGLCGYFEEDDTIVELMTQGDAKGVADRCIDFANDAGGKDNITVIALEVGEGGQAEAVEVRDVLDILGGTEIFENLSYRELVELASLGRTIELQPDTTVVEKGEMVGDLIMIQSGSLAVENDGRNVAIVEPGACVGELALVGEYPAAASYIAVEPTDLFVIPREKLLAAFRRKERLGSRVLWNFLKAYAGRLRQVPIELGFNSELWEKVDLQDEDIDLTPPPGKIIIDEEYFKSDDPRETAQLEATDRDRIVEADSQGVATQRTTSTVEPNVDEAADTPPDHNSSPPGRSSERGGPPPVPPGSDASSDPESADTPNVQLNKNEQSENR